MIYITVQKFGDCKIFSFLIRVSYVHQSCIDLIRNKVKQ